VLLRPLSGQFECEFQNPINSLSGKARLLKYDFAFSPFVHAAADAGILALGVLAHDEEVDVARLAIGQRRADARHEAAGPQVHVLVELAPELDQHAPQRDVIGHGGRPSHGAEEERVVLTDQLLPTRRHHRAVPGVVVAAPVEVIELQFDTEPARRRVEHAQALGHHFLADAVAGDHCDLVSRHAGLRSAHCARPLRGEAILPRPSQSWIFCRAVARSHLRS